MTATFYLKVKPLSDFDHSLGLPQYQTKGAAGADIKLCLPISARSEDLIILPMQRLALPTGLSFEIPSQFELQVRPRSGLSFKSGLTLINPPGTIDSDYRGELKILVINLSAEPIGLKHGDRIAQLVLAPVLQAHFEWSEELQSSERGSAGLGSTGR